MVDVIGFDEATYERETAAFRAALAAEDVEGSEQALNRLRVLVDQYAKAMDVARTAPCTKVSPGLHLTCLQSLAEGWITASDLCPRCTRLLMAGLKYAAAKDEPLSWHPNYIERTRSQSSSR